MKKVLCFLLILLSISMVANKAWSQKSAWGIRGGLNLANVYNSKFSFDSREAFMAGVYLNYRFARSNFSAQPELIYTQRGYEKSYLNYIELPLLLNFHLLRDSLVNPRIYAGPYMAFKVRAGREQAKVSPDRNYKAPPEVDQKFTNRVQDLDFGIAVGAGFTITRFNFGIRYNLGVTPVFETTDNRRNRVVSIVAGVQI